MIQVLVKGDNVVGKSLAPFTVIVPLIGFDFPIYAKIGALTIDGDSTIDNPVLGLHLVLSSKEIDY